MYDRAGNPGRPVTCSRKRTARVARRARSRLSGDFVAAYRKHSAAPYIAVQSPSLSSERVRLLANCPGTASSEGATIPYRS